MNESVSVYLGNVTVTDKSSSETTEDSETEPQMCANSICGRADDADQWRKNGLLKAGTGMLGYLQGEKGKTLLLLLLFCGGGGEVREKGD